MISDRPGCNIGTWNSNHSSSTDSSQVGIRAASRYSSESDPNYTSECSGKTTAVGNHDEVNGQIMWLAINCEESSFVRNFRTNDVYAMFVLLIYIYQRFWLIDFVHRLYWCVTWFAHRFKSDGYSSLSARRVTWNSDRMWSHFLKLKSKVANSAVQFIPSRSFWTQFKKLYRGISLDIDCHTGHIFFSI